MGLLGLPSLLLTAFLWDTYVGNGLSCWYATRLVCMISYIPEGAVALDILIGEPQFVQHLTFLFLLNTEQS